MADKRAFAKFDVGYLDNPKMLDVLDASSTAILMHFASVLYCAQHLTDGIVPTKAIQRKAGGSDGDAQILLDAGLWHAEGHECPSCPQPPAGKTYVHDFLEHNRDAAQAKRVSEKRSEAATAMWEKKKAMQNALQPAQQNDDVCNAERERKKEREEAKASSAEIRADVLHLCNLLADLIEGNGSKRPRITKVWMDEARRMIDLDEREPVKAERLMRWTQRDTFWRKNIMSMAKFREKYDQLRLAANEDWEKNRGGQSMDGEIDVDAVLGRDVWTPPAPPPGLSVAEEIEWKKQQRAAHKAERLEEAKRKLGAAA